MESKNIYQAINGVMSEIGAVGKNKRNEQQKYMYRGIDDVMTALSPAMQKHGVFVTPEVMEQIREEKEGRNSKLLYSIVKVKYTFRAMDGSSIEAVVMGEGMDSGDKATNKAMSAAFKYALLQTFCIPTEELIDSEQDSPEVAQPRPVQQAAKQVAQQISGAQPMLSQEQVQAIWSKLIAANVNVNQLLAQYKVRNLAYLNPQQVAQIEKQLEAYWNGRNRNPESNHSGDSYGESGFAENV